MLARELLSALNVGFLDAKVALEADEDSSHVGVLHDEVPLLAAPTANILAHAMTLRAVWAMQTACRAGNADKAGYCGSQPLLAAGHALRYPFGMQPSRRIPNPVISVVAAVLTEAGTGTMIERWFRAADAMGQHSGESKAKLVMSWLDRLNRIEAETALDKLGLVIQEVMEFEPSTFAERNTLMEARSQRIVDALARHDLSYQRGGLIVIRGASLVTKTLEEHILARDWPTITAEFDRTLTSLAADPATAVTAACALLESLCKVYIAEEHLEMPDTPVLLKVWPVVQKHIGLDPAKMEDDDIKKILSGLTSVAKGIADFRTHAGSAHGRGPGAYRVTPRHARLAVSAAHTLAVFVMETWDDRRAAARSGA